MPSAPWSRASSKAAIVFSGASAEAPRCAMIIGRVAGVLGPVSDAMALSSRAHADPRHLPTVHRAGGAGLLRPAGGPTGADTAGRPADHRAQSRDVRGPGAGHDPDPAAGVL